MRGQEQAWENDGASVPGKKDAGGGTCGDEGEEGGLRRKVGRPRKEKGEENKGGVEGDGGKRGGKRKEREGASQEGG